MSGHRKQYGCNFISAMPTNLYGPGDNFHTQIFMFAALLSRFHQAKINGDDGVTLGNGQTAPWIYACWRFGGWLIFLMKHYSEVNPINIGTGRDMTIQDFAHAIETVGFEGSIKMICQNLTEHLLNVWCYPYEWFGMAQQHPLRMVLKNIINGLWKPLTAGCLTMGKSSSLPV